MALPILDGNQSATTLSTILSSGQHIPAHTVVSLGTQAITDISGAVSGSVVSISNFPSTQTIAGTVTANLANVVTTDLYSVSSAIKVTGADGGGVLLGGLNSVGVPENVYEGGAIPVRGQVGMDVPISGTVTVGNTVTIAGTVTIGAGTAQIGSVTASVTNPVTVGAIVGPIGGSVFKGGSASTDAIRALPYFSQNGSANYNELSTNNPLPIAGTITVGSLPALVAGTAQIGSVTASISNSVTISSLPAISGAVTANGFDFNNSNYSPIPLAPFDENTGGGLAVVAKIVDDGGAGLNFSIGVPISGTVTANVLGYDAYNDFYPSLPIGRADDGIAGADNAVKVAIATELGGVNNSNPLPISGTVTAVNHQGTAVTTSNFTSTTASTVLASANTSREVLTIFNEGAGNLHICAGATCTTIAYQVRLSAGDYYEVPLNQTSLTHSAVFATAGTARVTEVS